MNFENEIFVLRISETSRMQKRWLFLMSTYVFSWQVGQLQRQRLWI